MFPFFQDDFDNTERNVKDLFQAYWSLNRKKRDVYLSYEDKEKFNFDDLSKADKDSELLKDFRKLLEESSAPVGDKELVFESPVRKEGVTEAEIRAFIPRFVSDERIVVVPLVEMKGIRKKPSRIFGYTGNYEVEKDIPYATLQIETLFDDIEEDLLISEWLKENGEDFLVSFYGSEEETISDTIVENKISVFELDGDKRTFIRNFNLPEILNVNMFASEYAFEQSKDVEIQEVKRTLIKPLKEPRHELEVFGDKIFDRSKIVHIGFAVIGFDIRKENVPIYREIQEFLENGTYKQLLKEREEMDKKNAR